MNCCMLARLVAQRCLYGVDKNPMAVDLAKLSLWLATLASEHPFTFLDHALRHGDSLVGLTKEQIRRFHWKEGVQQMMTGQERLVDRIKAATRVRQDIIEAGDEVPFLFKGEKLAEADAALNPVRFAGNAVIAAFFSGDNDKKREVKRVEFLKQVSEYLSTGIRPPELSKAEQECEPATRRFSRFIGRLSFRKYLDARMAGLMRWLAILRSG